MEPLVTYLRDLRDIRSSGANAPETSFYGPLANLLNEIGRTLKPRVRCIINPKNQGGCLPERSCATPRYRAGARDVSAGL